MGFGRPCIVFQNLGVHLAQAAHGYGLALDVAIARQHRGLPVPVDRLQRELHADLDIAMEGCS